MLHASNLPRTAAMVSTFLLAFGATDAWAENCRSVYVISNVRDVVDCPADRGADFCIVRTSIVDRGGLLTGRLEYFEDSSKGAKHPDDPSMELYVGVSEITTEQGTVEVEERGIFDTNSLEFAGLGKVKGGTGELAGYSGTLTSTGNAKGTGQIEGTICKE
jgi:hypothetical protein